jgi:carboxyl-terminal processing protease
LCADRQKKAQKPGDEFYRFVYVAEEVHNRILNDYVDEISSKELLEGAIRGMFLVLDEHSSYLDSDSIAQLEKDTEGEFSGVGIHITLRQGLLTVIAPIPAVRGAPGRAALDRIIEIEGNPRRTSPSRSGAQTHWPRGHTVTFKVFVR